MPSVVTQAWLQRVACVCVILPPQVIEYSLEGIVGGGRLSRGNKRHSAGDHRHNPGTQGRRAWLWPQRLFQRWGHWRSQVQEAVMPQDVNLHFLVRLQNEPKHRRCCLAHANAGARSLVQRTA